MVNEKQAWTTGHQLIAKIKGNNLNKIGNRDYQSKLHSFILPYGLTIFSDKY